MKPMIRPTLPGLVIFLLLNHLLICTSDSQTVDSFNVPISDPLPDTRPIKILTAFPLPDGRFLAAGDSVTFTSSNNQSHTNIVRINADGSVDDTFNTSITLAASSGLFIGTLALQTNGQVLAGGGFQRINGQYQFNLSRLNSDGSLDPGFNVGYMDGGIHSILVQTDGKILICGTFSVVNSKTCHGVGRLNPDGSLDTNFNAGANERVWSMAIQPDGKLVVAGFFSSIGGQSRTNLARLNADGSLDSSFQPVTFSSFPMFGAMSIQPDGKILIGGLFTTVNGSSHTNIVRLNPDGTLDTGFNAQLDWYDSWGSQTFTLQTDGKILIGDDSQTMNGQACPYLGRLNADGTLDTSFNTRLVTGTLVFSVAMQPDGRMLIAGWYDTLGGLTRNSLGRLSNTSTATQSLSYDGTNILWLRGGTSPEVWRTSFESSVNGADWSYLGDGSRVTGGWQLTNVNIGINAIIRARGFMTCGEFNGSSWYTESLYPKIMLINAANNGGVGFQTNAFGFNFIGSAGLTSVVDAVSSPLLNWTPIATNTLPEGPLHFNDPASTNFNQRFYRVRLLQ